MESVRFEVFAKLMESPRISPDLVNKELIKRHVGTDQIYGCNGCAAFTAWYLQDDSTLHVSIHFWNHKETLQIRVCHVGNDYTYFMFGEANYK